MKNGVRSFKELVDRPFDSKGAKHPFLLGEDSEYSYRDVNSRIRKVSSLLKEREIKEGDLILLSLQDDYSMISLFLALIANGITVIPIDPESKARTVQNVISSVEIVGWIVDEDNEMRWDLPSCHFMLPVSSSDTSKGALLNKLLQHKPSGKQNSLAEILDELPESQEIRSVSPDTIAYVLFTSGTTAEPKGVQISHKNLFTHLDTLHRQYQLSEKSVISNILTLFLADGLIQGPVLAYYIGITLSRPFDFELSKIPQLFDSFYKHRVSHIITVPAVLVLLERFSAGFEDCFDYSEFKFVVSSAAPLETGVWERFMKKFEVKVVNAYGLTETVAESLFCGPDEESWKVGSIGKPVDCEALIIDEAGNELSHGKIGELVLRGDHIMQSYLNSSDTFENGWFPTGDLACQDEEGHFFIKGRKKDLIIRAGVNIYPSEIVEILNNHPGIEESYVYGQTDEVFGERVVAVIVQGDDSQLTIEEVIEFCRNLLEVEKTPSEFFFVKELPRGPFGKVKLEELKAKIETDRRDSRSFDQSSLKKDLVMIASQCFNSTIGIEDWHVPSNNVEGWNSLDHLEFVTRIEKHFKIQLTTVDIMNISDLATAQKVIQAKLSKEE